MSLNQIWRTQLGTIRTDETLGITSDSEGNVIIAGYTTGELAFGQAQGGYDAWLVKLAADGHELWRKQFGTKLTDQGLAVAKFNSDGKELWRRQIGTEADEDAHDVSADSDGNVAIVGYTGGE